MEIKSLDHLISRFCQYLAGPIWQHTFINLIFLKIAFYQTLQQILDENF